MGKVSEKQWTISLHLTVRAGSREVAERLADNLCTALLKRERVVNVDFEPEEDIMDQDDDTKDVITRRRIFDE